MFMKLIALLQVFEIKCSYFDRLVNSDATASALQYSLISTDNVLSLMKCLSACTLNTDCLTAAYRTTELNCCLFKDQLGSSDIVSSTTTNLYFKKSSKLSIS